MYNYLVQNSVIIQHPNLILGSAQNGVTNAVKSRDFPWKFKSNCAFRSHFQPLLAIFGTKLYYGTQETCLTFP